MPGPLLIKARQYLVIDFGSLLMKIIQVRSTGKGLSILDADIQKISVTTEDGYQQAAGAFINTFLKRESVSGKDVIINISSEQSVFIKSLTLPVLPEGEILSAAKWQLKEEVHFDIETALIDWQPMKEHTDEDGVKQNIFLFAVARKETVDKYLDLVMQANLNPCGVLSASFSYANLLQHAAPKEGPAVIAVLDIDQQFSTLSIYKDQRLNLVRKLPISWEKFTESLTEIIVVEQGKIRLSYGEAEEIKNTFGIPQDLSQRVKNNIYSSHILTLMRPLLEAMVRELKLSFQYFQSHFETEAPSVIYLTGCGANLKNLERHLAQELGIKADFLPVPKNIDLHALKEPKFLKYQKEFMSAIAAALSDTESINFLPGEVRARRKIFIQKAVLRLMLVIGSVIFLLLLSMMHLQIRDYESRLKNAQMHLQAIDEIKILQLKIEAREKLIAKLQKGQIPSEGLLKVISQAIPAAVVLEELHFDQAANSLLLKGAVSAEVERSETLLTDFMEKLEGSLFIDDASLVSSNQIGAIQQFEIKCDLVREPSDAKH